MSSFYEALRQSKNDAASISDEVAAFNDTISKLSKSYAKSRGIKEDEAANKIKEFVRYAGKMDGNLSEGSTGGEVAKYGNELLTSMDIADMDMDFKDYLKRYGTDEQKTASKELELLADKKQNLKDSMSVPASSVLGAIAAPFTGGLSALAAGIYGGAKLTGKDIRRANRNKNEGIMNDAYDTYNRAKEMAADDVFDIFDNYKKYVPNMPETPNGGGSSDGNSSASDSSSEGGTSDDGDTVTFTLPRANDPNYKGFGQKIVDLGLATDKGLWGSGGDVEFYTQQLYDQGALDSRGNLKIGVPITLRRRK